MFSVHCQMDFLLLVAVVEGIVVTRVTAVAVVMDWNYLTPPYLWEFAMALVFVVVGQLVIPRFLGVVLLG